MSDHEDERHEQWLKQLQGDSVDECIAALHQIIQQDSVTGLALWVVPLAGSLDDDVRIYAAEAMESTIRPTLSEQLILIQLLESTQDSEICYWAATMLGRLGSDAGAAAVALETCVRQSMYLPARERAAWALSQIGPAASVALPTLHKAAETAPPRLKHFATVAIERIEGKAQASGGSDASEEAA
ncbi:MAG: HEAT repeat domain-containing protein [Rubripirellula sp.]|nr:HEAT repeat domain-containing protein [Rubripirellula sp.]